MYMISGLKIPKLIRWIFWMAVIFLLMMSLLRLAMFLFFNRQGNGLGDIFDALELGLRYDVRSVSAWSVLVLIIGSIPFLDAFATVRGRKTAIALATVAGFLLVFFYAIDFAHYSYLSQRLNASILNYLADAGISVKMVWQTYPVIKIILILGVGTYIFFGVTKRMYRRTASRSSRISKKSRVAWFIVFLLVAALGIFGRVGQYPLRWSDAFALGSDYKAALALNPFQSFFSSLKFRHSGYDLAKVKNAYPLLAPYYDFPVNGVPQPDFTRVSDPAPAKLTPMPNVVVVICESFSGYKSSMWGNPLNTTPFFKQLCDEGIFFDHCFTPTYGTARGVWAVITGIPDIEIATTTSSRNPAAVDQHTIINNFEGYDKYYFLGGSTSWANIRGLLTNNIAGLHLYEQENFSAPKVDVWGISDKNLFLEANKVLKTTTKPFFAIIQTADNHRPYTLPDEDQAEFKPITVSADSLKQFGFESNEEMNAFRYTDFGYKKFIETARNESYFNNTIFLFVGDHGIAGSAGTMLPNAWTNQRLSSEHVPMLVYAPKLLAAQRINKPCSQVDVLPTLAGLCKINYTNTTLGRDLLDSSRSADKAFSFIYDPDLGYIGLVKGDYFYRRQLKTGAEELVPVFNNDPVPVGAQTDSTRLLMKGLTEGVFETAKYMVLNNKKKK